MLKNTARAASIAAFLSMTAHAAQVQPPEDVLGELIERNTSDYLTQSEQNIMMMPDNPALWTAEEGKDLFYLVPEREVDFVFSGNVLDSDPMVEVGDLAEAAAAEAGNTIPLTD